MENRKLQKLAVVCISVFLCGLGAWWNGSREAEQQARRAVAEGTRPAGITTPSAPVELTVCVSGAVKSPGLYRLPKGSRGQDAIKLAGGVTEEADLDRVNLAQLCKEGGHIKVPRLSQSRLRTLQKQKDGVQEWEAACGTVDVNTEKRRASREKNGGEADSLSAQLTHEPKDPAARRSIHLNTATAAELRQLPGVGEATARRILAYREQRLFNRIEEIMQVPGIGERKFARMKDFLAL